MRILMTGLDSIHTTRQVKWLLDRDCKVSLLSPVNPLPNEVNGRFQWISPIHPRGVGIYGKIPSRSLVNRLKEATRAVQHKALFQKIKPQVIHANWIDGSVSNPSYYFAITRCKPLVLNVWGTDVNQYFEPTDDGVRIDKRKRYRTAMALKHADAVIVDAADMYEKCESLAQKSLRFEMMPLGIDTDHFRPMDVEVARRYRRKLKISDTAKVIVSIRATGRRYGHHYVLEAFARAVPKLHEEAVLVFRDYNAPADDASIAELKSRAEELGILNRIRVVESVPYEQLREIYALADLIVNYPVMDAFPVTFIEAAACCRRVVSCSLPAYRGTFAEQCFRMVKPEDSADLCEGLVDELNRSDSGEDERLTEIRRRIESEFSENVSAQKLISLYQSFL